MRASFKEGKKRKMVRTQIQLTRRQADSLKRAAAAEGLSMAEIIRRAVDGLLAADTVVEREDLKRRALAAAGIGRSGLADVADEHDRYLEESYGRVKP